MVGQPTQALNTRMRTEISGRGGRVKESAIEVDRLHTSF